MARNLIGFPMVVGRSCSVTAIGKLAFAAALVALPFLPPAKAQGIEGLGGVAMGSCYTPGFPYLYRYSTNYMNWWWNEAGGFRTISGTPDPLVETTSVFFQKDFHPSNYSVTYTGSDQLFRRAPLSVPGAEILTNPANASVSSVTVMRFPSGLTVNVGREAKAYTYPFGANTSDRSDGCSIYDKFEQAPAVPYSQIYSDGVFPVAMCGVYSTATWITRPAPSALLGITTIIPPVLRGFTCFPNRPVRNLPLSGLTVVGDQPTAATYLIAEVSPYTGWGLTADNTRLRDFFLSVASPNANEGGLEIIRSEASGFNLNDLWLGGGGFPGLVNPGNGVQARAGTYPSASQIDGIIVALAEAGVNIVNHKRVIIKTNSTAFPEAPMIDGSGGPLCDRRRIETDAVIATAYYKLGGVYCSALFRSTGGTGGTGGTNMNLDSTNSTYSGGTPGQTNSGNARNRSNIGTGTRGTNSMAPGTGIPDSTSGLLGYEQMPR